MSKNPTEYWTGAIDIDGETNAEDLGVWNSREDAIAQANAYADALEIGSKMVVRTWRCNRHGIKILVPGSPSDPVVIQGRMDPKQFDDDSSGAFWPKTNWGSDEPE